MAEAIVQSGSFNNAPVMVVPPVSVVQTGSFNDAPVTVVRPLAVVQTGSFNDAVVQVPADLTKALILKPVVTLVTSDCSYITIEDQTGDYNGTTNTWGYNPEDAAFDPSRPKRSELDLYCGWINYPANEISLWTFSPTQDISADPWEIQVGGLDAGVNQFFLIGVPTGTTLTELQQATLPFIYETTEGWYGGSCPVIGLWCSVSSDMVAMRRIYNNHTMVGGCEYTPWLIAWGNEKAVVSSMQAGFYAEAAVQYDEWVKYINKHKTCNCKDCG